MYGTKTSREARREERELTEALQQKGLHMDEYKIIQILGAKGFRYTIMADPNVIAYTRKEPMSGKESAELSIPLSVLTKKHGVQWGIAEPSSMSGAIIWCYRLGV